MVVVVLNNKKKLSTYCNQNDLDFQQKGSIKCR